MWSRRTPTARRRATTARSRRLPAALIAALALAACGGTPADEQLIEKFFEQSRLYDRTMLARLSTVVYDPVANGSVDRFQIVTRDRVVSNPPRTEVTILAQVRDASGRVSARTLVLTLEERDGANVIVGIR